MAHRPDTTGDSIEKRTIIVDFNYVIFVLGIVILTVVNSLLLVAFRSIPELQKAVLIINWCLSGFLLVDAVRLLLKVRQRSRFLFQGGGWLVFLGSLPVPFFGVVRLIHSWRMLRVLRHSDYREARQIIVTKRAQSTLLFVVLTTIIVYEVAVLLMISVEGPNPSTDLNTANDALWWGYVTMSTVGYGDLVPVTTPGRIVGVALMTVGVGLFSAITSVMGDWLRRPRESRNAVRSGTIAKQADSDPFQTLTDIRAALERQEKTHQETISQLQAQLDELEVNIRLHLSRAPIDSPSDNAQ